MLRLFALTLALWWPWEAHTSGSSTVRAEGAHLEVSLESVRKIIDDPEVEADWHARWRAEHQPVVEAALARMEPALARVATAEGLSLASYSAALPEAWSWAPPEDPRSPEQACGASGCRVLVQLWTTGVPDLPVSDAEIAPSKAPSREALTRVARALAEAAAVPSTPPPSP